MEQAVLKEIGAELKKRRQDSGVTLLQMSTKLRIRKLYLEGIETGNKNKLPSEAYVLGYIKKYARAVGMDEHAIISQIKLSRSKKLASIASDNLITEKQFIPAWLNLTLTAIVLIIMYVLVYFALLP